MTLKKHFEFYLDHVWSVYGHEPMVADSMVQEEIHRLIDLSADDAIQRLEAMYPTAPEDKRPPSTFVLIDGVWRDASVWLVEDDIYSKLFLRSPVVYGPRRAVIIEGVSGV